MRYNLLLEPILKKTAADSSDRAYVEQALAVIRRQSTEADEAIAITKSKIFCRNYSKTLVRKVTDIVVSCSSSQDIADALDRTSNYSNLRGDTSSRARCIVGRMGAASPSGPSPSLSSSTITVSCTLQRWG